MPFAAYILSFNRSAPRAGYQGSGHESRLPAPAYRQAGVGRDTFFCITFNDKDFYPMHYALCDILR